MRTGDDRLWAPITMKRKSATVAQGGKSAPRPILSVRTFWQRVDPLPDEK